MCLGEHRDKWFFSVFGDWWNLCSGNGGSLREVHELVDFPIEGLMAFAQNFRLNLV